MKTINTLSSLESQVLDCESHIRMLATLIDEETSTGEKSKTLRANYLRFSHNIDSTIDDFLPTKELCKKTKEHTILKGKTLKNEKDDEIRKFWSFIFIVACVLFSALGAFAFSSYV